jgi:hypothetical protein
VHNILPCAPYDTASDRALLAPRSFQIFQAKRPTSGQFNSKLPEFVKRLEEQLYRQASSKASLSGRWSLPPSASCGGLTLAGCPGLQEEYADLQTLESRLHDVAKKFVKAPGGGPPQQAGGAMSSLSQQQQNGAMPAGMGMGHGMGLQQQQQQQQQPSQQQQQFQMPSAMPQGYLGNGVPGGVPDMRQGHMGGAMAPGGMMQGQVMPQMDAGGGLQPAQMANGLIPTPNNPSAFGAGMPQNVMGNGAPMLLRNQNNREWPGGAPGMLGVSLGGRGPQAHGSMFVSVVVVGKQGPCTWTDPVLPRCC